MKKWLLSCRYICSSVLQMKFKLSMCDINMYDSCLHCAMPEEVKDALWEEIQRMFKGVHPRKFIVMDDLIRCIGDRVEEGATGRYGFTGEKDIYKRIDGIGASLVQRVASMVFYDICFIVDYQELGVWLRKQGQKENTWEGSSRGWHLSKKCSQSVWSACSVHNFYWK